jgi:hypothetical protein
MPGFPAFFEVLFFPVLPACFTILLIWVKIIWASKILLLAGNELRCWLFHLKDKEFMLYENKVFHETTSETFYPMRTVYWINQVTLISGSFFF